MEHVVTSSMTQTQWLRLIPTTKLILSWSKQHLLQPVVKIQVTVRRVVTTAFASVSTLYVMPSSWHSSTGQQDGSDLLLEPTGSVPGRRPPDVRGLELTRD